MTQCIAHRRLSQASWAQKFRHNLSLGEPVELRQFDGDAQFDFGENLRELRIVDRGSVLARHVAQVKKLRLGQSAREERQAQFLEPIQKRAAAGRCAAPAAQLVRDFLKREETVDRGEGWGACCRLRRFRRKRAGKITRAACRLSFAARCARRNGR